MRIIVNGAGGHMGKALLSCAAKAGHETLSVDKYAESIEYKSLSDVRPGADVIIDFSHHAATAELCAFARERSLPLVIATTGHTAEETALIEETAKVVPVFRSYNMSLGVALLIDLAKKAAAVFPDADIEIVETHHRRKIDAPSGTAKMLFEGIREVLPDKKANCGRSGMGAREKDEIGISSLRMGNIVGVHEVHFTTDNQTVVLRHEAFDRALFAEGALAAAKFILDKPKGLYTMKDMI